MENCVKDVTAAASVVIHFTPWIISKLMVADEEDEKTVRSYSTLLVMTRRGLVFGYKLSFQPIRKRQIKSESPENEK